MIKMPKIGKKSRADKINYSMVFQPPAEWKDPNGNLTSYDDDYDVALMAESLREDGLAMKEYIEAREWLDQFYPCTQQTIATGRKHLLIVGTETWVEQVWSMKNDHYRGTCYLEYDEKRDSPCRYCGGTCPQDEDNSCDGYSGDIDDLYK